MERFLVRFAAGTVEDEKRTPEKMERPTSWTQLDRELDHYEARGAFFDSSQPLRPMPENPRTPQRKAKGLDSGMGQEKEFSKL